MMIARLAFVMVLALAVSVAETSEVQAQCGGGIGGFNNFGGYGYGGFGFDVGRLYGVLARNVPYYAAFPPVYYSAPVPRTYGYSPFAYPPGVRTPDLPTPTVAAKEIVNPFVKQSQVAKEEAQADKVTSTKIEPEPLAIVNPYVATQVAETEGPSLRAVVLNR